jgi:flagellar hook-associated protein 3 FlgL
MSAYLVSSQFLGSSLILPITRAQSALTTAMTEESTGQYADLGLKLGDQSGYELSLKEQVSLIQTLTSGNSLVSTTLATAQNALTTISASAQSTMQSLTVWTPTANSGATLQTMGQSALQSLIASTNATSGDQYDVAPMADYYSTPTSAAKTSVDQAFQAAFGVLPSDPAAAGISASAMQSFLTGPFAGLFSGSAWSSEWSSASSTNASAEIAPGQTVATSASANEQAFQELAQAYTMLSEFGGSQLSAGAQQAVASASSSLIARGQDSLTNLQAALGATQSAVTDANANASMSAQSTILQKQVDALDNVDPNATAVRINSLTNQSAATQSGAIPARSMTPGISVDVRVCLQRSDRGFAPDHAGARAPGDGSGHRDVALGPGERAAVARARRGALLSASPVDDLHRRPQRPEQ